MSAYETIFENFKENGVELVSSFFCPKRGTVLCSVRDGDFYGGVYNQITGQESLDLLSAFAPALDSKKQAAVDAVHAAKEEFHDNINAFLKRVALSRMGLTNNELKDELMDVQNAQVRALLFPQFESILKSSYIDALTGCLNANYLHHYFSDATPWGRANDKDEFNLMLQSLEGVDGVLFIDLNNFKTINDAVGHAAGDVALESLGNVLRHHEGVLPVRRSGDEFIVFGEQQALHALVETLRSPETNARLNAAVPEGKAINGVSVGTSCSCGFASLDIPLSVSNSVEILNFQTVVNEALEQAEENMMKAKALHHEAHGSYRPASEVVADSLPKDKSSEVWRD